ncbi:hypothetical protein Sa4125_12010 [Aureimonas sp. SA4125]|uniref:DUF1993 domain-containing protein n=1 Tax=Aureimonas sp. SA4125 TaxID=2826993 RepID=UPI001CC676AA|nr:DUF1993 domain-containing protein [Aureimonas sp. SA4125]BDA83659.1 hypothetical protein Sa4125_12010 [Aureimonas sp. SA4125]
MSLSIYPSSVGAMTRMLGNLSALLDAAVAHAEAAGIDPATLVAARLAPDMHPLSSQIQLVSDTAKGAGARLSGIEAPSFADTETTFPELKERIARTIAFLGTVDVAAVDASQDRIVTLKTRSSTMTFTGSDYLTHFALPNFYFHVSIAYAILRANGVPIGKMDYLGNRPAAPQPEKQVQLFG